MNENWYAAISVFRTSTGENELDEWIAPQRKAAIAQILMAVRQSPKSEIELAGDIFEACIDMPGQLDPFQSGKAKNRLKKVRRILEGVEKCAGLIDSDPHISATIDKAIGVQPSTIRQLLFELRTLKSTLATLVKRRRSKTDLPDSLKGRRPSRIRMVGRRVVSAGLRASFLSPRWALSK